MWRWMGNIQALPMLPSAFGDFQVDAKGTRLKYCRHCHIVYNRDPMAGENLIYVWRETTLLGSRPSAFTYEGQPRPSQQSAPGSKKRKRAPSKTVNPKMSKKKQPSNVKSARTRFKASTSNSGTCIFFLYFLDMDMDMDDSGSMAISSDDDSPLNSNADDGIS